MAESREERMRAAMSRDRAQNVRNEQADAVRFFRRADAVILAAAAVCAVLLLLGPAVWGRTSPRQPQLEILVGDRLYGQYDLNEDRTIRIGEGNVCEIRDGSVRMTEADCPDQVCVHTAAVGRGGGSIVCLPNQVVLRIVDADEEGREVDTIAE